MDSASHVWPGRVVFFLVGLKSDMWSVGVLWYFLFYIVPLTVCITNSCYVLLVVLVQRPLGLPAPLWTGLCSMGCASMAGGNDFRGTEAETCKFNQINHLEYKMGGARDCLVGCLLRW